MKLMVQYLRRPFHNIGPKCYYCPHNQPISYLSICIFAQFLVITRFATSIRHINYLLSLMAPKYDVNKQNFWVMIRVGLKYK